MESFFLCILHLNIGQVVLDLPDSSKRYDLSCMSEGNMNVKRHRVTTSKYEQPNERKGAAMTIGTYNNRKQKGGTTSIAVEA